MQYGIITIILILLLGGCEQPTVQNKNKVHLAKQTYNSPPPHKTIALKEIEDKKKKEKSDSPTSITVVPLDTMDKDECIAMISREKFDKYTAMFGSETASIKRCKMLKTTR